VQGLELLTSTLRVKSLTIAPPPHKVIFLDNIFLDKHGLRMDVGKYGCPSTHVGGPRQQNHHAMNAQILNNPHAREKHNENKPFDRMKMKAELEMDELQAQTQQME